MKKELITFLGAIMLSNLTVTPSYADAACDQAIKTCEANQISCEWNRTTQDCHSACKTCESSCQTARRFCSVSTEWQERVEAIANKHYCQNVMTLDCP